LYKTQKNKKKRGWGFFFIQESIAGATRNLEADLAACDEKVRANKKLMSGAGCRTRLQTTYRP
jgi:hypothetical protein